jgi:transcriptional regulator with XRE-family HTH domain
MNGSRIGLVHSLGREIARLRECAGLTQGQLATAIGHATASKISLFESDARRPSAANLAKLATALQTTVAHLRKFGHPYDPGAPRRTRRQRDTAPVVPVTDTSQPPAGPTESTLDSGVTAESRVSPTPDRENGAEGTEMPYSSTETWLHAGIHEVLLRHGKPGLDAIEELIHQVYTHGPAAAELSPPKVRRRTGQGA